MVQILFFRNGNVFVALSVFKTGTRCKQIGVKYFLVAELHLYMFILTFLRFVAILVKV